MTLILHNGTDIHTADSGAPIRIRAGGWVTLPDGAKVGPAQEGWTNGVWSLSTLAAPDAVPDGKVPRGTEIVMVNGKPKSAHILEDRYASEAERLTEWRESASCSRLQGTLTLGERTMAAVYAEIDAIDDNWALLQIINHADTWRRNSKDMQLLGYLLDYGPKEMDATFLTAMQLEV